MSLIFKRNKQNSDYYMIKAYSTGPVRKRRVRGADYLYLLISGLILLGIFQRVEISKLQKIGSNINAVAKAVTITPTPEVKYIEKKDSRVSRLEEFLKGKGSPLAPYAEFIIQQSDKNGIDWTIMVSIAGNESGFGINIKPGCHNPFGLGGTSLLCFSSWEEVISYEASLLNESYRINMASGIQSKYCPPAECNPKWSKNIVFFANEIMNGGDK